MFGLLSLKKCNCIISNHFLLFLLLLFYSGEMIYASVIKDVEQYEINEKTAIEVIIEKKIPETTLKDDRLPHVYRPRTPIFHKYHPENKPVEPTIKRHLLVDHPEINNNQGRKVQQQMDTLN